MARFKMIFLRFLRRMKTLNVVVAIPPTLLCPLLLDRSVSMYLCIYVYVGASNTFQAHAFIHAV